MCRRMGLRLMSCTWRLRSTWTGVAMSCWFGLVVVVLRLCTLASTVTRAFVLRMRVVFPLSMITGKYACRPLYQPFILVCRLIVVVVVVALEPVFVRIFLSEDAKGRYLPDEQCRQSNLITHLDRSGSANAIGHRIWWYDKLYVSQ